MTKRNLHDQLEVLFNPKSIAVIGATNSIKMGFYVSLNIINSGYKGKVYFVNPKEERIMGQNTYPKVSMIPDEVEVAVIITPAPAVPTVVEDCGNKGVKGIIVLTSDFSETGEEGAALERQAVDIARKFGMIMVGPNCMGIASTKLSLNASMTPAKPVIGPISIASQSGTIGSMFITRGKEQGIGISKLVSTGNEADLTVCDCMDYFGQDPETKVIVLYLEGIDDGQKFIEIARGITPHKPVIVLKGGKSRVGASAAASHTGKMAGNNLVLESIFRQCGIIQANTLNEVLDIVYCLTACPLPNGRRVGIVSYGGGWGILAADYCEQMGLYVPELPQHLTAQLDQFMQQSWNRMNPVDMIATVNITTFGDTVKLMLGSDSFDIVIGMGLTVGTWDTADSDDAELSESNGNSEQYKVLWKAAAEVGRSQVWEILKEIRLLQKPVFFVGQPTEVDPLEEGDNFYEFPYMFPDPERVVNALAAVVQYAEYRNGLS